MRASPSIDRDRLATGRASLPRDGGAPRAAKRQERPTAHSYHAHEHRIKGWLAKQEESRAAENQKAPDKTADQVGNHVSLHGLTLSPPSLDVMACRPASYLIEESSQSQ